MRVSLSFDPTTVNATTLGSAANLTAFEAQVNAAAGLFNATFLDPVTVNITVKYGAVGLGQSNQSLYSYSLSTVKDALKKDITSLDDLKTVNAMGTSGTVYLTHAQLKALGLIAANSAGSDGTITFDNTPGLIDFTHSSAMSATSYDLYGVATHEISEIMGRMVDVSLTAGGTAHTILTQDNTGGNFTIGSETLLKFNTAATGDRGDWDSTVASSDAFRAFASPGVVSSVSATDLRTLDVVGWDHKALDLVFAIDTTGSMGPYIDNVKANAISIANAAFGTSTAPIDTRIGIVGFKDAAGPNGPGENTDLLNFTEQDTYAARETATVNAINSISVGGGGDIPEGDNSALLYALQGNLGDWRRAAQDHKIILFTDAPIKDTGLAAQVAAAAATLGATVTSSTVSSAAGITSGDFTFTLPASTALALDTLSSVSPGGDAGEIDSVFVGPAPATISFSSQVYAIQVGTDSTATAGLTTLASSTGGQFFTGTSTNLSDIIKSVIALPTPPSIAGTMAGQAVSDVATISPFALVTLLDPTPGATDTVIVTPSSHANGLLSNLGGGSLNPTTGIYSVSGSPSAVSTALDGLVFTPTAHEVAPGLTVSTTFTVEVDSSSGATATDATSSVIATATAVVAPPIGTPTHVAVLGTSKGQAVLDSATITPFSGVIVLDTSALATEAVTVTPSSTDNGGFSNPGIGSIDLKTGIYTVTGSAHAVSAALQGLVFTPTAHEVAPGLTVSTTFTLQVASSSGASATDANSSVTATGTAFAPPTISGTASGQNVQDTATIAPFAAVSVADPAPGATDTVTVTPSSIANGGFSVPGIGTIDAKTGVYTVTGTTSAVSAALDGLVFTPTPHEVAQGLSVSTTFTLKVSSSSGASATDAKSSVTAIGTPTAIVVQVPTIGGTVSSQNVLDTATITPFAGVSIGEPTSGAVDTVTVTPSSTLNGHFANPGTGTINPTTGAYTVSGLASAVSAALDGLVFTPTAHQGPAGQTVTTNFTINVVDTGGQSATDAKTSVITTETSPTLVGLLGSITDAQQLELIYVAYFNRAADSAGDTFWGKQSAQAQAAGQSATTALNNIANAFTPQSETVALYPFLGTTNVKLNTPDAQTGLGTFVNAVFSNLFSHTADPDGKTYWVGQITGGAVGLGAAALAIANGAAGPDAIEVRNKLAVAIDFTTRTAAAGLGATSPLPASLVSAATNVLKGIDGTSLNDSSVSAAMSATTTYISGSATGGQSILSTYALAPPTTSLASSTAAINAPLDPNIISITTSDQLIDPGTGSHVIAFLPNVGGETLVPHTGGTDQVSGFDPGTDVLDLRSLLAEANLSSNGNVAALANYLTITDQGSDALLNFDPTGQGGGSAVVELLGLANVVTGLNVLTEHGAVRI